MRSGVAYSTFNGRLGIDDVDGKRSVALFGGGNAVRTVGIAPRTIGIDFRTNF